MWSILSIDLHTKCILAKLGIGNLAKNITWVLPQVSQSLIQSSNISRFDPTLQIFYNVQSNINLTKLIRNWRTDWQYYKSLQNLCENSIFVNCILELQYMFWIYGCFFTNLEKRTCSYRNSAFLINDWFQFLLRRFKSCNSNKKGSLLQFSTFAL